MIIRPILEKWQRSFSEEYSPYLRTRTLWTQTQPEKPKRNLDQSPNTDGPTPLCLLRIIHLSIRAGRTESTVQPRNIPVQPRNIRIYCATVGGKNTEDTNMQTTTGKRLRHADGGQNLRAKTGPRPGLTIIAEEHLSVPRRERFTHRRRRGNDMKHRQQKGIPSMWAIKSSSRRSSSKQTAR